MPCQACGHQCPSDALCSKCGGDPMGLDDLRCRDCSVTSELTATQALIVEVCDGVKAMLLRKNRQYGDSAVHPRRVFSRASAIEQIKVRLDDKVNRLLNQQDDDDEDAVMDATGYLILWMVARRVHGTRGGAP